MPEPRSAPDTRTTATYVRLTLATVVALLLVVGGFNLVVDPFAMYRLSTRDGLNSYKPATFTRMRLFKAYEVRQVAPRTIILGSSRSHLGFSCAHAGLRALDGPCYNLAFDGALPREMRAYLEHAARIAPLRTVVLGLDSFHLVNGPSSTRPDFDGRVLYSEAAPRAATWVTGDLRLLTTWDTLRTSVETVQRQHEASPGWFAPDGQRLGEVFFHTAEPTFIADGPRAYFDSIDRQEIADQTPAPDVPNGSAAPPDAPQMHALDDVRSIVRFCLERGIDLRILLTPSHVHQYEIARAVGAWPRIVQSKRDLVTLLDEEAARTGRPAPPLWDFLRYSSVTTETPPATGSRDEFQFYWDSSHFKQVVGDAVLDRVTGAAAPRGPADLGDRLTAANIDAELAAQDVARVSYARTRADDVAAIEAQVAARRAELAQAR